MLHLLVGVAQFTMTLRCIVFFVLFYISLIVIVLLYSKICSGMCACSARACVCVRYIAKWLGCLPGDQEVPGSIPGYATLVVLFP